MPLYELVCIARAAAKVVPTKVQASATPVATRLVAEAKKEEPSTPAPLDPTRALIKQSALQILDRKGVVRGFQLLRADKYLPYRMKRHQEIFDKGDYWAMQFYSSPQSMRTLSKALDFDERVIRHTVIKVGESLSEITAYKMPETL